jgi:hypothetical protein
MFTYNKLVFEEHSQMPLATASSGSCRGSEMRKCKNIFATELMNAVTHCQTVGPEGVMQVKMRKFQSATEGQLNAMSWTDRTSWLHTGHEVQKGLMNFLTRCWLRGFDMEMPGRPSEHKGGWLWCCVISSSVTGGTWSMSRPGFWYPLLINGNNS